MPEITDKIREIAKIHHVSPRKIIDWIEQQYMDADGNYTHHSTCEYFWSCTRKHDDCKRTDVIKKYAK